MQKVEIHELRERRARHPHRPHWPAGDPRAIEDAIAGRTPEVEDDQREHGTAEHRIAA